jgi:hypothetical protein
MFHRRKLPAARRPALDRDERVIAWAGSSSAAAPDAVVVATNLGLWLPGVGERLGWHEVHKATWSEPTLTVTAAEQVGEGEGYRVMADLPAVEVTLADPDEVPRRVRERVTRSVAHSAHHELPGGGGVRVVARRVPGVDGLSWNVRYDEGTDPDAEEVAEATAELVARTAGGFSSPQ